MVSAAAIIEQARSYLDTRWHHQARQPGRGLDCAGVVVCAMRAAGLAVADRIAYSRLPDVPLMRAALEDSFIQLPRGAAWQPADVLWLRFEREPQHVALWTGATIIHATVAQRRVVEHRLDGRWRGQVVSVWRHPGVIHE